MSSPIQNPLLLMQLLQQNQNPLGVGAGQQAPIIPPADAMGLPPPLPQSIPPFSPGAMQAGANLPQPSSMPQQGLENNPWYKLIQQLSPVILGAIGGPSMGYGAIQSQRIAQESQMRQQAQQAEIDARNEQLKIQREAAATQAKALTNTQTRELADWSAKIGVGIDEMATMLGITDPGPIAAAKSLEPMLKAERQKNLVYLDMETMKSYPTPPPNNPNLIEITKKELFQERRKDKEKAEDLYYVTLSDQGGTQYPTLIPASSVPEELKKALGKPLSFKAAEAQVKAYSSAIKASIPDKLVPGRDIPFPPDVQAQKLAASAARFSSTTQDVDDTAKAIADGQAVPTLGSYSFRDRTAIAARLRRMGYDQATAERDWKAVNKHLSTLNGAQQERLRQAITFTSDSLDVIDRLYAEWKQEGKVSGYRSFNKASLALSKQLPGKAGATAQALESQLNDLTSELGTVYKGGNSSTDESLRLAAQNLKADWNDATFTKSIGLIRTNLKIRKNSILTSEAVGVTPGSPYIPEQGGGTKAIKPKSDPLKIF